VGISDEPNDMFGKIMSVSDELMWRYFELLSFRPMSDVEQFKQQVSGGENPRNIKVKLALEIVERFYGKEASVHAEQEFTSRFQKGALPERIEEIHLKADEAGFIPIANLLKDADLVVSTSEALRMIKQGAVRMDGAKVSDKDLKIESGRQAVFQVGKHRFAKIIVG
jgi:tyrosyl-tRNA synthetase